MTPGSPVRPEFPGAHSTGIWDPLFTFCLSFLWKVKLLLSGAMGRGRGTFFLAFCLKRQGHPGYTFPLSVPVQPCSVSDRLLPSNDTFQRSELNTKCFD